MTNFKYSHLHTSGTTAPEPSYLNDGEIALNILKDNERIYFKNSEGEVVEVGVGVSYTKEETDAKLAEKQDKGDYAEYQPFVYAGNTRKTIQLKNFDSISSVILGDMEHSADKKGEGVNLVMLSKWDVADFGSTKVPINFNGSKERPTYNDDNEMALLSDVTSATTGKAETTYVDKTFVAEVEYVSTAKTIYFYAADGETELGTIDVTDFIKDGMVSDVEVTDGKLVITFNTDAGKEAIEIDITKIFNASNYYTKDDVDSIIEDTVEDIEETISGLSASTFTSIEADFNEDDELVLTVTKGDETEVEFDMQVVDLGNGLLAKKGTNGNIILSAGTF